MYPSRLIAYMSAVELGAMVVIIHSVAGGISWVHWDILIFLASVFAAAFFSIPLPRGNGMVSVEMPVLVAASIILGPIAGFWMGFIGTLNAEQLSGRVKWPSVLFNRAQMGLVGWSAGAVFYALGGSVQHLVWSQFIGPAVAASGVAYVGNMILVAAAISLRQHKNIYSVWRSYMSWATLNHFVMMPVVFLMVVVYRIGGPWPEFVFLVPLALSRWVYVLLLRIRRLYNLGMQAMLAGLEAKDEYTYGHSMRVGHYAGLLARHMGMPEHRVDLIMEAGRLHDIGKVGVPDAILKKPDRLHSEEMLTMQRHPVVGGDLLDALEVVGCVKNGAVYHHERFDGSGYPLKLKGEDIPIETRIISVVDAYDAMTSTRPYRRAMSHERAIEEISQASGTQLDPVVVDAFLDMVKHFDLAAREGVKFKGRNRPDPPQFRPS